MGDVLIRQAGYDEDFFLWTQQQAEALRAMARQRTNAPLDWENIAEEIESLGKRDRRGCESLIGKIIVHLLKIKYWPDDEPVRHWKAEIRAFRRKLERIMGDSGSLRRRLPEFLTAEQKGAMEEVLDSLAPLPGIPEKLKLRAFVESCVLTPDNIVDPTFFPDRNPLGGLPT